MAERSAAANAADEHFGVKFIGLNPIGSEMYSGNTMGAISSNARGRDDFMAGYEAGRREENEACAKEVAERWSSFREYGSIGSRIAAVIRQRMTNAPVSKESKDG